MQFSQFISNPQRMLSVSQQPLDVYQGQLRPIKPIRHHNVGRHSDDGRAYNEASLKRSGKWSCGQQQSLKIQCASRQPKEGSGSNVLHFFYFTHSSASNATPPSRLRTEVYPSTDIHLVSCSMYKPIVQLRELFHYIAGASEPVIFVQLPQCSSLLSSWPSLTQHPLTVCPQGRDLYASLLVFSCLALMVPLSWGGLWLTLAFQAASNTV